MTSYYKRVPTLNTDGTPLYADTSDLEKEQEIASILSAEWVCTVRKFGKLSPIDSYIERDNRIVGLLEIKYRPHPHDKYPTVYLNVRKWLSLTLGSMGMGVPAVFVVGFIDGIYWINVDNVDARKPIIGGCKRIVKSSSDREPIIEVPVDTMNKLKRKVGEARPAVTGADNLPGDERPAARRG